MQSVAERLLVNGVIDVSYTIPIVLLAIFLFCWFHQRARLVNGIIFNFFLASVVLVLAILAMQLNDNRFNLILLTIFAIIFVAIFILFLSMVFLLLWNARIVWKREAHTLANSLTLILGISLIVLWIIGLFTPQFPQWLKQLLSISPLIAFYLLASFYNYLTNLFLYQFNHPRYRQDYIIVLGAGLLKGNQVSPLLAQRIDRGIVFYRKQVAKGQPAPKLVFSGGQGKDESVPEGIAMQDYAIAQGIKRSNTLAETKSRTTFENMRFSRDLIVKDSKRPIDQNKVIFVTNNYHTFRAGIYARLAGVPGNGIGSKTSKYFLPNAIIREYLAIFVMKKRQHFFVIGAIVGIDVLFVLVEVLARFFDGH